MRIRLGRTHASAAHAAVRRHRDGQLVARRLRARRGRRSADRASRAVAREERRRGHQGRKGGAIARRARRTGCGGRPRRRARRLRRRRRSRVTARLPRVERVAEAVAEEVEPEDGQHDRQARETRRGEGASSRFWRPSFSIAPHDGRGRLGREAQERERGLGEDRPRERDARLDDEHRRRGSGGCAGRRSAPAGAPSARLASTNSRSLRASTGPRTTRAKIGVYTTAIARTTLAGCGPERRDDAEREEHGREREEHVHHAHEGLVDPAAGVARDEAERGARRPAPPAPRRRRPRATGARRSTSRARRSRPKTSAPRGSAQLGPAIRSCGTIRSGLGEREAVRRGAHDEERADDQEARERARGSAAMRGRQAAEGSAGERRPGADLRGAGAASQPRRIRGSSQP